MYQMRGFTLIELLVVVLIIGILSAVALPQYQKAVVKSRYMQLMTAGDAIQRAEEAYYLANGVYTNDLSALDIEYPNPENFTLSPDVRADGHAAINAISSKWNIGHIVYFDNNQPSGGRRECRVYNDDPVLHQMCQGLTNSSVPAGGCGSSECTSYVFR